MSTIPPPPGPETPTPSEDFSHIPPPSGEEHVNDVLDRKKKLSWKNFGGDGFLVSVAFHVLLAIIALFYIVSTYTEPKKNSDPEVFATGAGGGRNGDQAKIFEQPKTTRQVNVKMPARITSKGASSIVLPDTPQTASASFASGLTSGGMSKGFGGGSGGGEGTGLGIGKGGGRNFVSAFGARGFSENGLLATYYDMKYRREPDMDGNLQPSDVWQKPPTWHSPDNASFAQCFPKLPPRNMTLDADRYYKLLNAASYGDSAQVFEKYFTSKISLVATRLWIPNTPSASSPEAFEVADKCKGHFWCVTYRARISPPSSGRWRFVGAGDDMLAVKINKKNVLAWYWWLNKSYMRQNWQGSSARVGGHVDTSKLRHYRNATGLGMPNGTGVGDWVEMEKGKFYDFEVVIGDWGGVFRGFLLCEKEGDKYESVPDSAGQPVPKIYLFRTADEDPAPGASGLPVDFVSNSPVWTAKTPKQALVR